MGIREIALKDCPSCGASIIESAVQCPQCRSGLGHCGECNAWIVAGSECPACEKSATVRAGRAGDNAPNPPKIHFEAEGFSLLPLLLVRLVIVAACGVTLVGAIAVSELGPITRFLRQHGIRPRVGGPELWGMTALFLGLVGVAGSFIRRFRLRHTVMFGEYVTIKWGIGELLLNLLITAFLFPLTLGLAWPWLHVRYRQSFYRNCRMPARGGKHFGFQGTGRGVLGRFLMALLLLPLGIASAGFLLGLVTWMWVKWEQSNLLVPDRRGEYRSVEFYGSVWGYLGRWMVGWFLTLLTAGIYRPWARVAEWRWIAAHTMVS
jgi:hypothetical protein